jgi:hypothetical protein
VKCDRCEARAWLVGFVDGLGHVNLCEAHTVDLQRQRERQIGQQREADIDVMLWLRTVKGYDPSEVRSWALVTPSGQPVGLAWYDSTREEALTDACDELAASLGPYGVERLRVVSTRDIPYVDLGLKEWTQAREAALAAWSLRLVPLTPALRLAYESPQEPWS